MAGHDFAQAVLYTSVVAGLVSSAWMLRACYRPPARLLKRQLFHQAVGTFLIHLSKSALMTWPLLFGGETDCIGDVQSGHIIYGVVLSHRFFMHGLFCTVWFVDLHIAICIAASAKHTPAVLERLARWLPLVWLLGAIYGTEAVVVNVYVANRYDVGRHDYIGAAVVLVMFLLTLGLYLFAIVTSNRHHSPAAVLTRMRRRAMVYPAIFLVTVFPTVLRYLDIRGFGTCSLGGILSFAAEFSTPTINALAFWTLSGGMSNSGHGPAMDSTRSLDKVVAFASAHEEIELEDAKATASWRRPHQWRSRGDSLDDEVAGASLDKTALDAMEDEQEASQENSFWRSFVGEEEY